MDVYALGPLCWNEIYGKARSALFKPDLGVDTEHSEK